MPASDVLARTSPSPLGSPLVRLAVAILASLVLSPGAPLQAAEDSSPRATVPAGDPVSGQRVINGIGTNLFPQTVSLISTSGRQFCTGTLIGCRTVLTAAHCVCNETGADCQAGGADLVPANSFGVFLQHAGIHGVSKVHVPPNYVFGERSDTAVLELSSEVTGVEPAPINTHFRVGDGNRALVVGFGRTGGANSNGNKNSGLVTTAPCTEVPGNRHLCWTFESPIGAPGQDSNTCQGDSGGPLFGIFGDGKLTVAGVTSGGINTSCQTPDEAWDADVFVERAWIQTKAGANLGARHCGDVGPADSYFAPVLIGAGTLSGGNAADWTHEVPTGTDLLRFALNGVHGAANDFDFYVKFGSQASPLDFDCKSDALGVHEYCEFTSPNPGTWYIHVVPFEGGGEYQLSATNFTAGGIFADDFEVGDADIWSNTTP